MIVLLALACGSAPPVEVPPPEPVAPIVDPGEAIAYVVRFPEAQTQHFEVEVTIPTDGADAVELMMPVWTPGSYLVREFAQHVIGFAAEGPDGPLVVERTRKNRWRVTTGGADTVRASYRVWANHKNVRGNFVEERFAVLNGAPTFVTRVDALDRPHRVAFDHPWAAVETALDPHPDGVPGHFLARDFDELVDTPVILGAPATYDFVVEDVPHRLVVLEELGAWDGAKSAVDVHAIVRTQVAFWGTVPYDRYVFLNGLLEGGGGLEHLDSTLMLASRWQTGDDDAYRRWLGLVSHEFFHTWNVKRLRPVTLGPFDYENEVHTRDLWIAEGVTSYYDDLLLRRAGLLDDAQYLKRLSGNIDGLQKTPGRLVHALGDTSYDAWIEGYRRDANSANTTISYYTKGAVVAFLLDAEIRRRTGDRRTLDDVMRLAWDRYSGDRGYTSEEFRAVASEVAGADLSGWFAAAVDRPEELDYTPALTWLGLTFAEADAPDDPNAWLGLTLDGKNVITEVRSDTPAFLAGVNVGDEVVGVDEWRVAPGAWSTHAGHYEPDDEAELLVSRRGELRRIPVTFAAEPHAKWTVEVDEAADGAAATPRARWLQGDPRYTPTVEAGPADDQP